MRHRLLLIKGCFRCLSCGNEITITQQNKSMVAPTKCDKCSGKRFKLLTDKSEFKDLGPLPLTEQPTLEQLKKELQGSETDIIYEVE